MDASQAGPEMGAELEGDLVVVGYLWLLEHDGFDLHDDAAAHLDGLHDEERLPGSDPREAVGFLSCAFGAQVLARRGTIALRIPDHPELLLGHDQAATGARNFSNGSALMCAPKNLPFDSAAMKAAWTAGSTFG